MNTLLLTVSALLCVTLATAAPSVASDSNKVAAHLRNRRSQYANLMDSILELAERQEDNRDTDAVIEALAGAEEYGLLDNEELAELQDFVDKQNLLSGLLGSLGPSFG